MIAEIQNAKKAKDIYVDNERFAAEYDKWITEVHHARANGLKDPRITEYLGECILKICTRLTYMPSFYNYSWKNEFITNAIENCIKYFDRYDKNAISKRTGKKTAGPFSYFTTIAYWAFVRTILIEKKELKKKQKYISQLSSVITEIREYDSEEFDNEYINYLKRMLDEDFSGDEKNGEKLKKDVDNLEEDDILDIIELDKDLALEVLEYDEDEIF